MRITFASPFKSTGEKEEEKKKRKRQAIAKRFALHTNATKEIVTESKDDTSSKKRLVMI